MINKNLFYKAGTAGFMLGSVLMVTLTGCTGYVTAPSAGIYVAPPVVEVGVQDNYVYYPSYGIYFNSYRNQYAYMDGGVWVSRPEPMGVSVDVLLASPSVRMDFHDSPANHHAAMSRQYPKNWKPSGASGTAHVQRSEGQKAQATKAQAPKSQAKKAPVQKANEKEEKHDEHETK